MSTHISPLAGQPAPKSVLLDVDKLVAAYFSERPDATVPAQRVAFGTSGHRGSAFDVSFNEWHLLAITQAICDHRKAGGIVGPLFLGLDTHALSASACASALEVLAANGVEVMLATNDEPTPTPAISHAILTHNRTAPAPGRRAAGSVDTPPHTPPRVGGFMYTPPHGGPAGEDITDAIQAAANRFLEHGMDGVRRLPHARALAAATTHRHDYLAHYVAQLDQVIDLGAIRNARLRIGVDPLGGAEVHYWAAIAERWKIDLTVVSEEIDPTFAFMTLDWDGQIRMDPLSVYAMQRLIAIKDRYGIVTSTAGLLPPNHYLAVAIDDRFRNRRQWGTTAAVGKTVVSTQLIDRVGARLGRRLYEVPVGFKISAKSGWYAARPSGTEDLYKIYAESFQGAAHLQRILLEAQATVDAALALPSTPATT